MYEYSQAKHLMIQLQGNQPWQVKVDPKAAGEKNPWRQKG